MEPEGTLPRLKSQPSVPTLSHVNLVHAPPIQLPEDPSFFLFFIVGPVVSPPWALLLIVPPCLGSHLSPPDALSAQIARETSVREMENYGREMAE
jgi:hypothetical protein